MSGTRTNENECEKNGTKQSDIIKREEVLTEMYFIKYPSHLERERGRKKREGEGVGEREEERKIETERGRERRHKNRPWKRVPSAN